MVQVSYALRDDPNTIFLLQDAGRRYDKYCQISTFTRNIIRPDYLRQYLCFAPYTGQNGKYQGSATDLLISIEDNEYTPMQNYVAIIDSEVEFRVTPTVIRQLSKEHMPAWGVKSYLDYFSDRKTGILLFLRVFRINQELTPPILEKGVRGGTQVLKLYDENGDEISLQIDGIEPVISDNQFTYIKDEILHLLKVENAFIALYDNTESGLNSLQSRILADKLVQGISRRINDRRFHWINDTKENDDFDMAQLDYDQIYRDVLNSYPGMESIINYVKAIQPARLGEYDYYLKEIHEHTNMEQAAFNRLFDMSVRAAVKNALYYSERHNIDLEDVFQEACIGIISAIQKHSDNVAGLFPSYVSMWIRQIVSRDLQPYDYNFRIPAHYNIRIEQIVRQLEKTLEKNEFKRTPHNELYELLLTIPDCTPEEAYRTAYLLTPTESIEEIIEDQSKEEWLIDDEDFEENLIQSITYSDVRAALQLLPEREREILYLRYGFDGNEESSLETIGNIYGITRERVRQLEIKAERRLHRYLLWKKIVSKNEYGSPAEAAKKAKKKRAKRRKKTQKLKQ